MRRFEERKLENRRSRLKKLMREFPVSELMDMVGANINGREPGE